MTSEAPTASVVNWYDLTTSHPEGSMAFYQQIFPWSFTDLGPENGHYHMITVGDEAVAGLNVVGETQAEGHSAWRVYGSMHDAEWASSKIRDLGGQIDGPSVPMGEFGSLLTGVDPTGAPFGLWQPASFGGFEMVHAPGAPTWHELYADDAPRAANFYAELLGTSIMPLPETPEYLLLMNGDAPAAGVVPHQDSPWAPGWLPYFAVEELEGLLTQAAAAGGKVLMPATPSPYGAFAVLQDPGGAVFAVLQPPADGA